MANGHNGKSGNGNGNHRRTPGRYQEELTPQQELAIQLLTDPSNKQSLKNIAKTVGVAHTTLIAWREWPLFSTREREACRKYEPEALQTCAWVMRNSKDPRIILMAARTLCEHSRNAGNVTVSTSVTVHTPAQELREKPRTELGEILERELSTLNRLKDTVLVGSDPKPGKN